jgi:multidrug efflux pump
VTTVYPGASPQLMQGFITTPLEQAVSSAEGVDYITSSSTQGQSLISIYVKLNFDPNQALTEVMAKVCPPRISADATPSTVDRIGCTTRVR